MRINTSKTDATEATTTTRSKPSKGQLIAGTILGLAVIGGIANVLGGGNDSAATTRPHCHPR